ncbi:hypothetical protein MSS93_12315 [Deinococcus radiodurans]|nr:hypothetical protein MSS93_12315 [Deinococcus radiodurans]
MTRARTPSPGRPSPRRPRRPAGPRRWPELVAATLVLALGVGLGSLLLGERRAPAEPVAAAPQPTTSIPVSPGAVVADGSPQTAAPAQAQTTAGKIPPAPAAPPRPRFPPRPAGAAPDAGPTDASPSGGRNDDCGLSHHPATSHAGPGDPDANPADASSPGSGDATASDPGS